MNVIFKVLADYWIVGFLVLSALFVSFYWWFSFRLLRNSLEWGYSVKTSPFIPILHFFIWVRAHFVRRKNLKYLKLRKEQDVESGLSGTETANSILLDALNLK